MMKPVTFAPWVIDVLIRTSVAGGGAGSGAAGAVADRLWRGLAGVFGVGLGGVCGFGYPSSGATVVENSAANTSTDH